MTKERVDPFKIIASNRKPIQLQNGKNFIKVVIESVNGKDIEALYDPSDRLCVPIPKKDK